MKSKHLSGNILLTDNIKSKRSVLRGLKALLKSFDFLFINVDSPITEGEGDFKKYDLETIRRITKVINGFTEDKKILSEVSCLYEELGSNSLEIRDQLRYTYLVLKHNINSQLNKIRFNKIGNVSVRFIKLIRCFYIYPKNDTDAIDGVNLAIQTLIYSNKNLYYEKTRKRYVNTGFSGNFKLF